MSYAATTVFGCNDLRNYIFSYLRTHPEKECFKCKTVLVWDKKRVKQFIQMTWAYKQPTNSFCLDCLRKDAYMGPPCQLS